MFNLFKKNREKKLYLYGIPTVRMDITNVEPNDLKHDEEYIEGEYLPLSKDRGVFLDCEENLYIYIRNGKTTGTVGEWKKTLSEVKAIHEYEMNIKEKMEKWQSKQTPPHPYVAQGIIKTYEKKEKSFQVHVFREKKGQYIYIIESENIYGVTNNGLEKI